MPNLGSLWYTMSIKDLTDADLKRINEKLKNAGAKILLTPELVKSVSEILPKGVKLELDPQLKAVTNEMLAKAAEGKVMKVEVLPLLTHLRKALKDATAASPPEIEVGVQSIRLRRLIEDVLNKQGFLINVTTVNGNYTKVVQQKLNGRTYKVKIHADANEITRSVQASLMQVQSRYFGLQVSRDILYRSIDEALGGHRFNINIAVQHDQARKAVQDALLRAQVIGKDQSLAYQRLQTGELKAAQAELMRLKAAHMDAADAAKAHSGATKDVGNSLFSLTGPINEVKSMIANLWSINAAKQFLSQVIEIGGELEHQKIAMDTIFGDKGKTLELFGQIKGLARQSPFGVMELTKSVKALSAYGVEYNEIYDTAKRLADISAATSVDINRLILAFGKTKSRGFLDGLEAKQFAYANIPIYEMVRRKLEELEGQAVTTAQVMERMKKREIGFDIVKDVLWDITDEGGKFYNMQEALAGSVKTSWKLVRDNIELMFGEIAESWVGEELKDIAETLQVLTRNWRVMGAVIGSAALAFGIYKVAVAASNTMMGQHNLTTLKSIQAENAKNVKIAQSAVIYRTLTHAEADALAVESGLNQATNASIFTRKKLTLAQLEGLYASNALNRDMLLRLAATGRLQKGSLLLMRQTKLLTYADMRYLAQLRTTGSFMGFHGKTASALAARFRLLGASIKTVLSPLTTMLANPMTWIMATIGAVVYAWQRNSEQMEKAKEIGDNLFTRATESAKNLKIVLTEVGDEVEKLTDIKIAEAISKLETAIKDYSPTPEKTLRETRLDENGKIRSTQEYAKALQAEVKALEEASTLEEKIDIGKISENAMNNAKGIFDDNLAKDLEQYADSFKKADREISKYISDNPRKVKQYVDRLTEIDASFAEATKGMDTYAAKFREMVVNTDKYSTAALAIEGGDIQNLLSMFTSTIFADERSLIGYLFSSDPQAMKKARKEAIDELREYMGYVKTALEEENISVGEGVNMSKPVQIMMARLANDILENAKNLPQDQQDAIRELFHSYFGLDFDDTLIFGGISDSVKDSLDKLPKELSDKIRNGISYSDLEDTDKELADKLINSSAEEVEKKFPHLANKIHDKLKSEKFRAEIIFSLGKNANLSEWQRQLNDAIGEDSLKTLDISIQGKADINSFIDEVRKGHKAAKDNMNELGPIIMSAGITFNKGKKIDALPTKLKDGTKTKDNPLLLAAVERYNNIVEADSRLVEVMKAAGIDLDVDPNKNQRTPKDDFAESLKQRIEILKKAYSEYKKELAVMSKDAALNQIKEAGIFDELFTGEDAITDFDSYETALEKLLAKAEASLKGMSEKDSRFKGRHDLVISLRTLLNLEIPRDKTKEALDKAKREIDTLVSETTKKWDMYKRLFEFTGNKEASMKFAFSESVEWQSESANLKGLLDKQLEDKGLTDITLAISDEEAREKLEKLNLYDLWKKTKVAIENEEVELRINVAKAVYDAASNEEKIKILQDNRAARETEVRNKINPETGKKYTDSEIDALLKGEFDDKIDELRASMIELLPIWEQIFGDHQYQSFGQIQKIAQIANEIVANADVKKENGKPVSFSSIYTDEKGNKQNIDGKISQLEKLRKAIRDLYNEGLKKNPFVTLWENLKKVFNGDWKDKNTPEKLALIGESAAESAQLVGNLAGQLAEMFEAIGNDGMAQAMTDVQDVMSTVSNIGKGFAEGGLVGGIAAAAGEAIGWVTKAFQASARHKEALRAIMNETLAQQREYNLLLMQQNLEYKKAATILGEDTYAKAKNAVKVMKDAYSNLQNELEGTSEQQGKERRKANGNRIFTKVFGFGFDEAKGKLRQAYAGLADIEIKTGSKKKKFLGITTGQKDIYSSILDVYPELIDANGKFNASLAQTIINTRVMSDEDKAALQNMIDLANQAEAAYEELNSYMTDIFGELGSTMTDALVSAFANGTDAAEAFYDSVSDMLEALAKQMIYSVTLAPLIEEVQKKMMDVMQNDAMSDEQKFGAWTGILDGLLDDALKQQGVANDLFKKYQDMAAEKGFDIFKPDEEQKSGLSAGIQGITENTADTLASYLNAIRADMSLQTYDYWARLLNDSLPQISVIAQSQLDTQRQIAENTLRNAVAAETIVQYSKSIDDRLRRAQADKSTGFWMR